MDEAKENCEESEIVVVHIPGEGSCSVNTKAHNEISSDLEFAEDFTQEHVTSLSDLEGGGVKRKHEDIMHIDGSEAKSAHIEQSEAESYTAVESLEETAHSLETSTIPQEHVLSTISQACQADIITTHHHDQPTLLPNSPMVEPREEGVNQAWFTTKEDKDSLQGKGVKWRQGMWSNEENEILKENILQYCKSNNIADPNIIIFDMSKDDRKDFYRTIAKGIKRPLFAIYRRVLRMYDRRNYIGKYSPEEVKQLKSLKEKHGNDWATIGIAMGRSASSVKDRYRLLRENCQSGKWTSEEEERLSNAVHEQSGTQAGEIVTNGISWSSVAEKVQTRSEKQCRSKWLNYLNWKEKGGNDWTKQDEIKLINRIYELDIDDENLIDWKHLMANWTSVRSPQWLRSKWWGLKKHFPQVTTGFRDMVEYLHLHYVDTLQSKIDRQESRFKNSPISHGYGSSLRNLMRPQSHAHKITHTITVNSDGSIVTKDDATAHGITNQGRFEVLQLNNVSSPESVFHSQGNQLQPSYIIHSMQPSSIAGQTYIIQQPDIEMVRNPDNNQVDTSLGHGDQVQITPVVMTAVLHPNHSMGCLPEVNPELAQAIVQTDISGPIESTHHLAQTEIPASIDQTHCQEQLHSEITNPADMTSHPIGASFIDSPSSQEVESTANIANAEEVVSAVLDSSSVMVSVANSSLTMPSISIPEDIDSNNSSQPVTNTHYQTGPAAIAQSLDGTELCTPTVTQQISGVRGLGVTPLSSLVSTYSTTTSTCSPTMISNHVLQNESNDAGLRRASITHTFQTHEQLSTPGSESLQTSNNHAQIIHHSVHGQQSVNTLSHTLHDVSGQDELADSQQVSHHGLTSSNPNLLASDLVPQADLPEHFLQSQADDTVELTLPSSNRGHIVISSDVPTGVTSIHPELTHAGISASQVVVSISDVTMANLASSDSLMLIGHDGEECVIVEEECQ